MARKIGIIISGTKIGGLRAANTMKKRYGEDIYVMIGTAGGTKSRGGGFASNKIGADGMTGKERAIAVGSKGGKKSRRPVNASRMV